MMLDITGLPDEILNSAKGQMFKPMIEQMLRSAIGNQSDVESAINPNLPAINAKYDVIIDDVASTECHKTEESTLVREVNQNNFDLLHSASLNTIATQRPSHKVSDHRI